MTSSHGGGLHRARQHAGLGGDKETTCGHVALCYDSCGQYQFKFTNLEESGQKHSTSVKCFYHDNV